MNEQGNVQTCMEMNFELLYFIYGSLSSSLYTAFITGGGMLFLPGKHKVASHIYSSVQLASYSSY